MLKMIVTAAAMVLAANAAQAQLRPTTYLINYCEDELKGYAQHEGCSVRDKRGVRKTISWVMVALMFSSKE